MIKIKLYRFTVKHTEHLPPKFGPDPIISYLQTDWGDCPNFIPGSDSELVKVEEKEIEVEESCLRRKVKI